MESYELDGEKINYYVRRGKGRHAYLRVDESLCFEVVLPARSRMKPENLLYEKRSWIKKKLSELGHLKRLGDGKLLYRGELYDVRAEVGVREKVEVGDAEVVVYTRKDPKKVLKKWLRDRSREYVERECIRYAQKMGVGYGKIYLRDSKTRWGSCSGKKNLNFNYRIICLPPVVAEYLVVHELAHLKEMNHSPRYWKIVEKQLPERKNLEKQLRTYLPGMRVC